MTQGEGGKGDKRAKKACLLPNTPRPRKIMNKNWLEYIVNIVICFCSNGICM